MPKDKKMSSYSTSPLLERDFLTLIGTKNNPGICHNRNHAIEFSVRLTAARIRNGLDLRPILEYSPPANQTEEVSQ